MPICLEETSFENCHDSFLDLLFLSSKAFPEINVRESVCFTLQALFDDGVFNDELTQITSDFPTLGDYLHASKRVMRKLAILENKGNQEENWFSMQEKFALEIREKFYSSMNPYECAA